MIKKISFCCLLTLILVIYTHSLNAQPQWRYYHPNNSGLPGNIVLEIIIDSTNAKWFATNNGLARLKGNTWTVWDTTNSLIPNNYIQSIVKDKKNNIWIATRNKGIVKYDGINWTLYYNTNFGYPLLAINRLRVDNNNTLWACSQTLGLLKYISSINKWVRYYTANSGLPDNSVTDVQFENNVKWIGTVQGGIARFDDTSWTIYNHNNTPLESDFIERVGIDNFNNKWFCTRFGGVAKFNSIQNQWTIYTSTNSGLPWNNTNCIYFDEDNTKWIGISGGGFTIYNDTIWVTALDTNSTTVGDFKKDKYNNVWICASEGVWVYNPLGIVSVNEHNTILPKEIALYQNYPNPFNPTTKIRFSIVSSPHGLGGDLVQLKVYDVMGREVQTLVNESLKPGMYEVTFNIESATEHRRTFGSGVYFYKLITDGFSETKKMMFIK